MKEQIDQVNRCLLHFLNRLFTYSRLLTSQSVKAKTRSQCVKRTPRLTLMGIRCEFYMLNTQLLTRQASGG